MEQRHTRQDMLTFYNIINGKMKMDIVVEIIGNETTRGKFLKIRPKYARLESRRNSFFIRLWKYWNELPADVVKADSVNIFKNRLQTTRIFRALGLLSFSQPLPDGDDPKKRVALQGEFKVNV